METDRKKHESHYDKKIIADLIASTATRHCKEIVKKIVEDINKLLLNENITEILSILKQEPGAIREHRITSSTPANIFADLCRIMETYDQMFEKENIKELKILLDNDQYLEQLLTGTVGASILDFRIMCGCFLKITGDDTFCNRLLDGASNKSLFEKIIKVGYSKEDIMGMKYYELDRSQNKKIYPNEAEQKKLGEYYILFNCDQAAAITQGPLSVLASYRNTMFYDRSPSLVKQEPGTDKQASNRISNQ